MVIDQLIVNLPPVYQIIVHSVVHSEVVVGFDPFRGRWELYHVYCVFQYDDL